MSTAMEEVIKICAERNWTLSFAESCTGGLVSASLSKKSGVSKIFVGSVISYANSVKVNVLNVPRPLIQSLGAVSEPVARAMAAGVRDITASTWAVSITGIAGPGGGSKEKPVGTVCFALVGPGVEQTYRRHFPGQREEVQQAAQQTVWEILLEQFAKGMQGK